MMCTSVRKGAEDTAWKINRYVLKQQNKINNSYKHRKEGKPKTSNKNEQGILVGFLGFWASIQFHCCTRTKDKR